MGFIGSIRRSLPEWPGSRGHVTGHDVDLDVSKHEVGEPVDLDTSKHEGGASQVDGCASQPLPAPHVDAPDAAAPVLAPRSTGERSQQCSPYTAETGESSSEDAGQSGSQAWPVRGTDAMLSVAGAGRSKARTVHLSQLQTPMKCLGSGEFCSAYLTKLDGVEVVVKMLKPEQRRNPTAATDLQSEVYLMTSMRFARAPSPAAEPRQPWPCARARSAPSDVCGGPDVCARRATPLCAPFVTPP